MISDKEQNDEARNALGMRPDEGINSVLSSVIDRCERDPNLPGDEGSRVYDYNLRREHLKFEKRLLNTIWENLKKKWDDMNDRWSDMKDKLKDLVDRLREIKELLKKLFKAINTVLNSLKKAFHELEIVKEFKDLMNLMITWITGYIV